MSYQSHRDCAARYAALRPLFASYDRPITVLELGPAEGYFAEHIARDNPRATVVMIERHKALNRNLPGTIFLHREVVAEDLEHLARCEHFDVVLAMSVLHHFKEPARALRAVLTLGDVTVIETPPREDTVAWNGRTVTLWDMLRPMDKTLLAETPGLAAGSLRPLWLLDTPKTSIEQPDLARATRHPPGRSETMGKMEIRATPASKTVTFHRKGETRDWLPGINLLTYLWWGGVHPTVESVAKRVEATPLPEQHHGDMRPWNFVINRHGVYLIDAGDNRNAEPDAVAVKRTLAAIRDCGRYPDKELVP